MNVTYTSKGQAIPTHVAQIPPEAFDRIDGTEVR